MEPIGLIAGAGRFPVAFARKAQMVGQNVVCLAARYMADPELVPLVWRHHWVGIGGLGRGIRLFRQAGVRRFVMAGKIHKTELFKPGRWWSLWPDWRTLRFWYSHTRRDNKDDSLLLGIISEFARDGIVCESALDLCPELLVRTGILTPRRPTPTEERDIDFGWQLAKAMGELDVGQAVIVRNRAVLAVEAIEGTDQAILRAGQLCPQGGFVVVKVAKPQQDRRFDMPTVGPATIESIHRAGGRVLAIEAGQTILLDEADMLRQAERYGITVVAR